MATVSITAVVACLLFIMAAQASAARTMDDNPMKVKRVLPTKSQQKTATTTGRTAAKVALRKAPAAAASSSELPAAFCPAWEKCSDDYTMYDFWFTPGMTDRTWPDIAADKCISVLQRILGAKVTGTYDAATQARVSKEVGDEEIHYSEWWLVGWLGGCV